LSVRSLELQLVVLTKLVPTDCDFLEIFNVTAQNGGDFPLNIFIHSLLMLFIINIVRWNSDIDGHG